MCQIGGAHFGDSNGSEVAGTITLSEGADLRNCQPLIG
jgi:hypothetical protein